MTNQDCSCALLFAAARSTSSVVCRLEGKSLQHGQGHGQQAWAALGEKSYGCSRLAFLTERHIINRTKTALGQDPDEFLYIMDSCWDCLNVSGPSQSPSRKAGF